MKTLAELKSAVNLQCLEDIRAHFANSKEKQVQHYLSWGDECEGMCGV